MEDRPITIASFGVDDPLSELPKTTQSTYLLSYLADLGAKTVICEPDYFDRDYLAEFAAFYSTSAQDYSNKCSRAHFFDGPSFEKEYLVRAASGCKKTRKALQKAYLGFIVFRPIPAAPLGRTVLEWYKEKHPEQRRIRNPKRKYKVHVAGIELKVSGLAWQQQDSGVGACATVGVWSMLHSSAFDDHHAIPTTAQVTESAHRFASLGDRVYPSGGLTPFQIGEAIKAQNLAPVPLDGDVIDKSLDRVVGFSRERFASSCASFIRSGYPVLIIGEREDDGHAVCAVGFRPATEVDTDNDRPIKVLDKYVPHIYLHDDNIGPSVKFKIEEEEKTLSDETIVTRIVLIPEPPAYDPKPGFERPTLLDGKLYPEQLVVAVHDDLRTSPDVLHDAGLSIADELFETLSLVSTALGDPITSLLLQTRFVKLANYMGKGLDKTVGHDPEVLGNLRLALSEKAPPMSLHLGLVRIGNQDGEPLFDVLFDTTDSDRNHPVFATVAYNHVVKGTLEVSKEEDDIELGEIISAY